MGADECTECDGVSIVLGGLVTYVGRERMGVGGDDDKSTRAIGNDDSKVLTGCSALMYAFIRQFLWFADGEAGSAWCSA